MLSSLGQIWGSNREERTNANNYPLFLIKGLKDK